MLTVSRKLSCLWLSAVEEHKLLKLIEFSRFPRHHTVKIAVVTCMFSHLVSSSVQSPFTYINCYIERDREQFGEICVNKDGKVRKDFFFI